MAKAGKYGPYEEYSEVTVPEVGTFGLQPGEVLVVKDGLGVVTSSSAKTVKAAEAPEVAEAPEAKTAKAAESDE